MKLIYKDRIIAEIERRISQLESEYEKLSKLEIWITAKEIEHKINGLKEALSIVNTLEVKEVNLEKSLTSFMSKYAYENGGEYPSAIDIAKHFFELGLKKGQKNIWHSMDETPNYPCDILFLTDVDNMFLYRYMENGRPVDRETPYFRNILNGKCWCYCDDVKTQKGE